jgi:hypothetical protein
MKKVLCLFVVVCFMFSCLACGDAKVINGKQVETYGLFNKEENREKCIEYEFITGNAVLGVIFFETIVAPIYFYGFSLYEPKRSIANCSE